MNGINLTDGVYDYKGIRMVNRLMLLFVFVLAFSHSWAQWQSDLVQINEAGDLSYSKDADGFVLPDFSYAGYQYGEKAIPAISVVKQISAIAGDNTQHIQDAIDEVSALPMDDKGFRGALLLNAGTYEIHNKLYLQTNGVVLRGVGDADDSTTNTILLAKGDTPTQRTIVRMGNIVNDEWDINEEDSKTNILDDTVHIGSMTIRVENANEYNIGDHFIIYHPCTTEWLNKVDGGGTATDDAWKEGELPIMFKRIITNINNDTITFDAPVFYPLVRSISQCYIYKPDASKMRQNIGIENLRIDIESNGGEDENHAWDGIRFNLVENAWAKNCTVKGFGQAGFVTQYSYKITIEDCSAIDPVGIITGERMYNFNFYHGSQLVLIKNAYARNGRHHYVSNGTTTVSGCVVYNCESSGSNSAVEGHRKWTTGLLFDNLKETNLLSSGRLVFALYNRGDKGTAHGWSSAHCVAWNCDFGDARACIQKPPAAQNYAIGCSAKRINGDEVDFPQTEGYIEGLNQSNLEPHSLYNAQLEFRMNIPPTIIDSEMNMQTFVFIFPNPCKGTLNIKTTEAGQLSLYNGLGQLVYQSNIENYLTNTKLDSLKTGLYYLNFNTNSYVVNRKIIIEN